MLWPTCELIERTADVNYTLHCVLQRIYLRQHNDQHYLVAFNVWAQEQVVKLSGQGQGRIVLSTCMNREGPFDLSELRLPWNEGASLNSWFRSSRYRFDWRHLMRAVID